MEEKFAFCLARVRHTTKGRTYRPEEIFKTGGDNPPFNDAFYQSGHFILADSEKEVQQKGYAELKRRGIIH